MIDAGILNGDKIICEKAETADNGDIVVAMIEDSATVKRFFRRNGKIVLHPENQTMADIIVDNACVIAKVKGLLRKYR